MDVKAPVKPIIEDPVYFAERGGLYALGKNAIHYIEEPLAENIVNPLLDPILNPVAQGVTQLFGAEIFGTVGSGLAMAVRGFGGIVAIGLTAAVSAGLTQMDYNHKREGIKNIYKEELAAKLKKPIEKVTAADLDTLAKENHTVSEALRKTKRQRNFGVFMSIAASLAAMATVNVVMKMLLPPGLTESLDGLSKIVVEGAIRGAVGLAAYLAVKTPLHWLGDKLFDLDEKTAHDKIEDLAREHKAGKILSEEQILAVYVEAHPKLEEVIATKYGAKFDELPPAVKQQAVEDMNEVLPLKQLVQDIKSKKINVGELAFAIEGEASGVRHEHKLEHKKPGFFNRAMTGIGSFFRGKPQVHAEFVALPDGLGSSAVMTYEEHTPAKEGFVQRVGYTQIATNTHMGYKDFIEKQRVQAEASASVMQQS